MGMFTSLFGSSGSDKSDKMRQSAIDAFNAVKTPDLSALQVKLQNAVVAGTITPEQAEAQLLNSNAFNAIKTDPSLQGAQKQALQSLQDTASAGGLTAVDKAQLQDITDQQNQENKSSNASIMEDAASRGMGNANSTTAARLIAEQGAADRASKSGLDVAAQAQQRALQALQAAGSQATNMQTTDFNQQAAKASSQNAIDQFNAANKTDMSKFNVANNLNAQNANVANAQHVEDNNTATQNAEKINNANANQTVFNDNLQKANGIAGVDTQWANQANKDAATDKAGDASLTAGLVQAGGTAAAGPIGSLAASSATSGDTSAPAGYKPKMAPNQGASLGYSEGGEVKDSGSNPHAGLEEEYQKFVQNFCNGGVINMADGGKVHIKPGKSEATPPLPIEQSANDSQSWTLSDPNKEPIGDFPNYSDAADFAAKVQAKQPEVKDFKSGGRVPGVAKVAGDSPKNDTVPANLSPGEVVLPRTIVAHPEKAPGFVKASTGYDPIAHALRKLAQPKI